VPAVVVDYDPAWPAMFDAVRSRVWPAVAPIALAVEHVGSTAVPGLAAKPIIDVDVVVAAADVGRAVRALAALGYEDEGDLGVPGREALRAPATDLPYHHLYVVVAGRSGSPACSRSTGSRTPRRRAAW
jgi:GrpB-like predicted nucleotidyltransferase (UPF0157 family)